MDWDDIKIFLSLVRNGSVRTAATRLGVSHSTVARRIDALEQHLRVRLFERLSTGYVITPAGEEVLGIAEGVENDLDSLERQVLGRDQQLAGSIRLTTVDFMATHLLMPHLAAFSRLYPDIDLELVSTYETADMSKREADVALRFTTKPPDYLVGRVLATLHFAPYASVDYLRQHKLHDATDGRWIGFSGQSRNPKWVRESPLPQLPARNNFHSILVQFEAAKAGMGVAMLPCLLGDATAALTRVSGAKPRPAYDLWILTHKEVRTTARLRIFTKFLGDAIIAERPRLEGRITPATVANQP